MSVYLDYNASSPIDPRVLEVMIDVYKNYIGNPDSRTHDFGDRARGIVENSRKQVASLLGISAGEVFFTSGATESNNIAIQGLKSYAEETGKKHIITSTIEHKAVLETAKHLERNGFEVEYISPNESGRIDAKDLLSKVRQDTLLVTLMHVNNETGIIQPVDEIGNALAETNVLFHVDATQSCGKLVDEIRDLKYNMLSFSAHKLCGPQGIGCLVLRKKRYKLPPVRNIMFGGQQEHGIRPGTVPVALTAGCGKACELAYNEHVEADKNNKKIRDLLLKLLDNSGIKYIINGDPNYCINSTLNVSFEGVSSEALMIASKQYCSISNGSACTSNSYSPSYVLSSMGLSSDRIESSIRISWGNSLDIKVLKDQFSMLLGIVTKFAG